MSRDIYSETVARLIDSLVMERKRLHLSQQALADLAGVSRTGIRHMESGNTNPTLYTLLKVAKALELDFSILISNAQK